MQETTDNILQPPIISADRSMFPHIFQVCNDIYILICLKESIRNDRKEMLKIKLKPFPTHTSFAVVTSFLHEPGGLDIFLLCKITLFKNKK